MGFRIDSEGKIHRDGSSPSQPANTSATRQTPQHYSGTQSTSIRYGRSTEFSFGYAFLGLVVGGATGISLSALTKLLLLIFSNNYNRLYNYYQLEYIYNQVFSADFFSQSVMITTIIFAVVGFFLDGFESAREKFSVLFGSLGFLFAGFDAICLSLLFLIIILLINEFTGSNISFPEVKIVAFSVFACAVVGFIWNGFGVSMEKFSLHRAFWGRLCGIIFGVIFSVTLVFSGCLMFIGTVVLFPLAMTIASLIVLFYSVKGYIVYGKGGAWEDL